MGHTIVAALDEDVSIPGGEGGTIIVGLRELQLCLPGQPEL